MTRRRIIETAPNSERVVMSHRGKLVILGMLVLAIGAGSFAIWYLRGLSARSTHYFGTRTSALILQAPEVRALRLAPTGEEAGTSNEERIAISGQPYTVIQRRDASQANGLINVRRGLMNDASYNWSAPQPEQPADWQYGLEFRDESGRAVVVFAPQEKRLMSAEAGESLDASRIAAGLEAFLYEQFQ